MFPFKFNYLYLGVEINIHKQNIFKYIEYFEFKKSLCNIPTLSQFSTAEIIIKERWSLLYSLATKMKILVDRVDTSWKIFCYYKFFLCPSLYLNIYINENVSLSGNLWNTYISLNKYEYNENSYTSMYICIFLFLSNKNNT